MDATKIGTTTNRRAAVVTNTDAMGATARPQQSGDNGRVDWCFIMYVIASAIAMVSGLAAAIVIQL